MGTEDSQASGHRTTLENSHTPDALRAIPGQLRDVPDLIRDLCSRSFPPSTAQLQRAAVVVEEAAATIERLTRELAVARRVSNEAWWGREKALAALEAMELERDALERERDESDRTCRELRAKYEPEHRGCDWAAVRMANRAQS